MFLYYCNQQFGGKFEIFVFELSENRLRELDQFSDFIEKLIVRQDAAADRCSGLFRPLPNEFTPLGHVDNDVVLPQVFAMALQIMHLDPQGAHEPVAHRHFAGLHMGVLALQDLLAEEGHDPLNRPGKSNTEG